MIFLLKQSRGSQGFPADHRSESRLSIPRRGALQRSSEGVKKSKHSWLKLFLARYPCECLPLIRK
jgi:hypothetical protein